MTTKRERYDWSLTRESGKYSEYEMLKIVNGRTGKELNQIIDCLKGDNMKYKLVDIIREVEEGVRKCLP